MEQLAIRLSHQKTLAKSLVMSVSKGMRLRRKWFDKLTTNGLVNHPK